MDHSGKAFRSALRLVGWSFVLLLAIMAAGIIAIFLGNLIAALSVTLVAVWGILACLVFYLFRDPDPYVPSGMPRAVLSPSHGEVLAVDESDENELIRGRCHRITIRPGFWDVHVPKSPVSGMVTYSVVEDVDATAATLATVKGGVRRGEMLCMGLVPLERSDLVLVLRMAAGRFPREAQGYCKSGDALEAGDRLGLLQMGSHCELYVPMGSQIHVKDGDRVRGGETLVATLPEKSA